MFDTISIGSATLDIFLKSHQFAIETREDGSDHLSMPYGGKIDVEDFALQSGGGATNTAVGFARAGLRAAVISEMGKDLASQLILKELEHEKVDTSLLVQEKGEQTAISALLVSGEGGRSAVTARGAAQMLTLQDIPFARLRANWIHLSSIGNLEVVTAVAKHCHQQRISFSWNPGGAELSAIENGELHLHEIHPTLFCVNAEEADRIMKAGYQLETAGTTIVVTDGRKGGKYYEHGKWQEYHSLSTQVVQETGAGDAFISGMVIAYLHDRLTPIAVEWGSRNAAAVVGKMGAKTGLLHEW